MAAVIMANEKLMKMRNGISGISMAAVVAA